MPHLRVEYTHNLHGSLSPQPLLQALTAAVCASAEIADEADVKARIVALEQWQIGTAQTPARAFVHAELRLLSGRSAEAKKDFSDRIAAVLRQHIRAPEGLQVQLSVDIVDMERPCYFKGLL